MVRCRGCLRRWGGASVEATVEVAAVARLLLVDHLSTASNTANAGTVAEMRTGTRENAPRVLPSTLRGLWKYTPRFMGSYSREEGRGELR